MTIRSVFPNLVTYVQNWFYTCKDERFLFRPILKTKKGEKLRESGRISYSCLRDQFRKKLTELGFPAEEFGLHSQRSGGASATANAKVPDRLLRGMGDGDPKMLKMAT